MDSPFIFTDQIQQFICKVCKFAVPANSLTRHLQDSKLHREQPAGTRKRWVEECASRSAQAPENCLASYAVDGAFEVPELPTIRGYRCRTCDYRSAAQKKMRQHLNQKHGVKISSGRPKGHGYSEEKGAGEVLVNPGSPDASLPELRRTEHWAEHWMQSIFGPQSPHHRYHVVKKRRAEVAITSPSLSNPGSGGDSQHANDAYESISLLFKEASAARAARNEHARVTVTGEEKEERTPWLKTTGWLEHLKGLNLKTLVKASAMPKASEPSLRLACDGMQAALERALRTLGKTDKNTRQWWRSPMPEEIAHRPMEHLQSPGSFVRYSSYWQRFLAYCLRVNAIAGGQERFATHRVTFTPEQKALLDKISSAATGASGNGSSGKPSGRAIMELAQLFAQEVLQDKFMDAGWANPLVHFTAVLGINEYTYRLKQPEDYTSLQAGVLYCSRLVLLQACHDSDPRRGEEGGEEEEETGEEEGFGKPGGLPNITGEVGAGQQERRTPASIQRSINHYTNFRRRWLTMGTYTPMALMLNNLAFGMKLAKLAGGRVRLIWDDPVHKTRLRFEGQVIKVNDIRVMVHGLVREARELMWRGLLFTGESRDWEAFNTEEFEDHVVLASSSDNSGVFRLHEPGRADAGAAYVTDRLLASLEARETMLLAPGTGCPGARWTFKESGIKAYKRKTKAFLEKLFVLVHVTGGAPARGTEIGCLRFRSSVAVDRGLFVVNGKVVFIAQYNKTTAVADRLKVIPRFLPPAIGELVGHYLTKVRPFLESVNLATATEGGSKTAVENGYLWTPGAGGRNGCWDTDKMSKALGDATDQHLGVRLGIRSYRHVAVALSRDIVHRHRPAAQQFKDFAAGDPELMREFWADNEEGSGDGDGGTGEESLIELGQAAAAAQTGHSVRSRLTTYGQIASLGSKLSATSLEIFRQVSEEWHAFLGFEDEDTSKQKRKEHHKRQMSAADIPGRETKRPSISSKAELEKAINKTLTQGFGHRTFKSAEQAEAVLAVVRGERLTVVVLPTGGGKSLVWMLASKLEAEGVTVVVVPYISLLQDMLRRCREAGLKAAEWKGDGSTNADVDGLRVLVTLPERAVRGLGRGGSFHETFFERAWAYKDAGLLRRIVVDECHTVLSEDELRSAMGELYQLRGLEVPMVFMTATLPPRAVIDFEKSLGLTGNSIRYIRGRSQREDIDLRVIKCGNGRSLTVAMGLLRECEEDLGKRGMKAVVYCRTKKQAAAMGGERMLNCGVYTGEADDEEREKVLREWLEGEGAVFMVSTTAFGQGIDISKIAETYHVGMPYSMLNLIQESGRCRPRERGAEGKGGKGGRGRSTIVVEEREVLEEEEVWKRGPGDKFQRYDVECLHRTVRTLGCRMVEIGRYVDEGDGLRCGEQGGGNKGEQGGRCDNCRRGEEEGGEGNNSRLGLVGLEACQVAGTGGTRFAGEKIKNKEKGIKTMLELLTGGGAGCMGCSVSGADTGKEGHLFFSCKETGGLEFEDVTSFSRSIKWPGNFGICWGCGLPESICGDGTEWVRGNKSRSCKYKWAVATVCLFCRMGGIAEALTMGLDINISELSMKEFGLWVGSKYGSRVEGLRVTNGVYLLYLFLNRVVG